MGYNEKIEAMGRAWGRVAGEKMGNGHWVKTETDLERIRDHRQ